MKLVSALLVLALLTIAAVFFLRRPRKPVEPPFPELIATLRNEAVSIAKDSYGITLDYSPASVAQVEEILGKLHADYQKHKTTEGQRGLALAFGVYIGEVILKQAGSGHWERDHPAMGEGAMALHWNGVTSFPVAWCIKRLANGDEDNVAHKYQVFVTTRLEKRD